MSDSSSSAMASASATVSPSAGPSTGSPALDSRRLCFSANSMAANPESRMGASSCRATGCSPAGLTRRPGHVHVLQLLVRVVGERLHHRVEQAFQPVPVPDGPRPVLMLLEG